MLEALRGSGLSAAQHGWEVHCRASSRGGRGETDTGSWPNELEMTSCKALSRYLRDQLLLCQGATRASPCSAAE